MKISYSIAEAALMVGYSERTLKTAIANGNLVPRYANSKAIIRHQDLEEWVDSLSAESPSSK